ncbi:hypothetical protein MKW92_045473 [Papaver armeniacum]|nr:hypothetical protein MKW92_045473 [Papaver armeniacum]
MMSTTTCIQIPMQRKVLAQHLLLVLMTWLFMCKKRTLRICLKIWGRMKIKGMIGLRDEWTEVFYWFAT